MIVIVIVDVSVDVIATTAQTTRPTTTTNDYEHEPGRPKRIRRAA
ncbi:MAG: hypothetical protein AB7N76_06310 [Planctomycetota bacterium]